MSELLWNRQMEWAATAANQYLLEDPSFREQALERARGIMKVARNNVEELVQRLTASGYEFAAPEMAHQPPSPHMTVGIEVLASRGVYVPIALQAWLEEVGCVSLMGSHPEWTNTGCQGLGDQTSIWLADPLVVYFDAKSVAKEFAQYRKEQQESEVQPAPPFCISFSPDDAQKAAVNGVCPYQLPAAEPSVDPVVLNERRRFSFVAHLRHAFKWGGFPGFEFVSKPPQDFIDQMSQGLEPL